MLERLREFAKSCPRIAEVRGLGMMIGVVLHARGQERRRGVPASERLLVNGTADNVLRMLPPLNADARRGRRGSRDNRASAFGYASR